MKVSVVLLRSKVFTLMVRSIDLQTCEEPYVVVYITGPILIRDKDKYNVIGNSTEFDSHHYTVSKRIHLTFNNYIMQ